MMYKVCYLIHFTADVEGCTHLGFSAAVQKGVGKTLGRAIYHIIQSSKLNVHAHND